MKVVARDIVSNGFPPEEGKRLADALIEKRDLDWNGLVIDVTTCPPALLISAFFNGFLQEIFDRKSDLLERARKVDWALQFPFQSENVRKWMRDFQPYKGEARA